MTTINVNDKLQKINFSALASDALIQLENSFYSPSFSINSCEAKIFKYVTSKNT
jgi:hypothetical protein